MARKPEKIVSIAPFYQTKTPSRNCVFQHPALVALGMLMHDQYETSLNEAIEDLMLRRQHEHEAHKAALHAELNAQIDREIEAKLKAEGVLTAGEIEAMTDEDFAAWQAREAIENANLAYQHAEYMAKHGPDEDGQYLHFYTQASDAPKAA